MMNQLFLVTAKLHNTVCKAPNPFPKRYSSLEAADICHYAT